MTVHYIEQDEPFFVPHKQILTFTNADSFNNRRHRVGW